MMILLEVFIHQCHKTRMWLYEELLSHNLWLMYLGWITIPILLILFSAGFAHIVSPQVDYNQIRIKMTHY